jgi:hypothetical protein
MAGLDLPPYLTEPIEKPRRAVVGDPYPVGAENCVMAFSLRFLMSR